MVSGVFLFRRGIRFLSVGGDACVRRRERIGRLALSSGLPEDALSSGARVTMMGRGCVLVEGQHGVVELGAHRIRLRTSEGVLSVSGRALSLRELSMDAALICGEQIDTASYAKPEREGQASCT